MTKLHLCGTGGTLAMGYVPTDFLKTIDPVTYKDLNDGEYLYPLYDIRHFILAAKVCATVKDDEQRALLLGRLVATKDIIIPLLLEKHLGHDTVSYETTLDQTLEAIANDIGVGTISSVLLEYGIQHAENSKPYYIDSTDFSLTEHYPKLFGTAETFFKSDNQVPDHAPKVMMIIGGTDTKEIYASLLAKDLMRHGHITKTSQHSLFFLSSMASFGDNPERIGNYFCAAFSLAKHNPKGAFALITKDKNASEVEIHGVTGKFAKISSKLIGSFRSDMTLGHLKKDTQYRFEGSLALPNNAFVAPTPAKQDMPKHLRIAPPLMSGNHPATIAQFMKSVLEDKNSPYNGIIIEGIPGFSSSLSHAKIRNEIICLTKALSSQGITVFCVNDYAYNVDQDTFTPVLKPNHWNYSQQLQKLESAGAVVVNRETALGCYTSAVLGLLSQTHVIEHNTSITTSNTPQESKPLALRYIPDPVAFEYALDMASHFTNTIVISALPDSAIPQRHATKICELSKRGVTFHIGFRYNGTTYEQESLTFVEGTSQDSYAAHLFPERHENIKYCGIIPPAIILQSLSTSSSLAY